MTLAVINKSYDELKDDMKEMKALRDSLLEVYDILNRPVPDNVRKMIWDATQESERYRDLREGFANRLKNFEENLLYAGYSDPIMRAICREFEEFLRKN